MKQPSLLAEFVQGHWLCSEDEQGADSLWLTEASPQMALNRKLCFF